MIDHLIVSIRSSCPCGTSFSTRRFVWREFRSGGAEVGHLHIGGGVDIPFPHLVRDALLAEGRAEEYFSHSRRGRPQSCPLAYATGIPTDRFRDSLGVLLRANQHPLVPGITSIPHHVPSLRTADRQHWAMRSLQDMMQCAPPQTHRRGAAGVISREEVELAETGAANSEKVLEASRFKARAAAYDLQVARAGLVALAAERGDKPRLVDLRSPISGHVLRLLQQSERVVSAGTPILQVGQGDLW